MAKTALKLTFLYSPQCPSVFPTIGALRALANEYSLELITRDVLQDRPTELPAPAMKLLDDLKKGSHPSFFFATLFLDEVELPGFPINLFALREEICRRLQLVPPMKAEPKRGQARREKVEATDFSYEIVAPDQYEALCSLCMNHHPLGSEGAWTAQETLEACLGLVDNFLVPYGEAGELVAVLASWQGEPAGMVEALQLPVVRQLGRKALGDDGDFAIVCLTVRAEFQKKGIGRGLLKRLCARLAELGAKSLQVHATRGGEEPWQAWHSRQFFEKCGFELIDEKELIYRLELA